MSAIQPFIRLVCEGDKTEPNYFNQWLRSLGFRIPNAAFQPKNHSPKGIAAEAIRLLKEAKRLQIPSDRTLIFAVFDRDGHSGIPDALEQIRQAGSIVPIFSSVCFEVWFLLHFERSARPFENCEAVVRHIRATHDPDYAKANDHFERLKNRLSTARENAVWLENQWKKDEKRLWERNPMTDTHRVLKLSISF